MNSVFKSIKHLLVAIMLMTFCVMASAATQNYSTAVPGVVVIPLHLDGQFTATTNPVAKFAIPFGAKLIGVSANARASGGTSPTLTVDVEDDGTSVLSSAISITAGTISEGTIANATIADESVIEVVLTIGGSSPTWDDITVLMTVVRN
tara:strand:- start:661 stop:1107 length:447 start_codon:yes stop_codon:yes gene_type:complete